MALQKVALSILIPTIAKRYYSFNLLLAELNKQIGDLPVEILFDNSEPPITIGKKRNNLLDRAKGNYVCFFDDDDTPTDYYISTIFEGIKQDVDCVYLRGVMTTNGRNPEIFEHSIKYNAYKTTTNEIKYERYPNHLNTIKSTIAKQFKFKEKNWGEDTDWATDVFNSGLIKTEYYSDKVLYNYRYLSNK